MEAKNEKILPWQFSIQNGSIKFAKFGKKKKISAGTPMLIKVKL